MKYGGTLTNEPVIFREICGGYFIGPEIFYPLDGFGYLLKLIENPDKLGYIIARLIWIFRYRLPRTMKAFRQEWRKGT